MGALYDAVRSIYPPVITVYQQSDGTVTVPLPSPFGEGIHIARFRFADDEFHMIESCDHPEHKQYEREWFRKLPDDGN